MFPNVIYGRFGQEKTAQSAAIGSLPIGQEMVLPDGRKFNHSKAGGTALSAGALTSTSATQAGLGGVSGSGLVASATTTYNLSGQNIVHLTTAKSAITVNQFAGGYLNVQGPAASTYIGYVYRIKSNLSAAVSADLTVTLEETDPLKVSFKAGITTCSLRTSPYADQIVFADGTAPPSGIVPTAVSASFYFWLLTGGVASARQSATVAIAQSPFTADTAAAGSITIASSAAASTDVYGYAKLGWTLEAAAASECILVNLMLK